MSRVLVTGFGAFPGVADNPTAALARALDGRQIGAHTVVGRVLPVSYRRGPEEALQAARDTRAVLVLGLGVAMRRSRVCVERRGVRVVKGQADVDGQTRTGLIGPDEVTATLDVAALARALDARVSDDAGRYVCNAWLYRMAQEVSAPVGFVHVPAGGLAIELLLGGIAALLPRLSPSV